MFGLRVTAVVSDLVFLFLAVLSFRLTPDPHVPNLPVQLLVLGVASGTCSLLFLVPNFRGRSAVMVGVAKTLFLCLIFLAIPRGDAGFLALWASYSAVLVFHLGARTSLTLVAAFAALAGLFLFSFPTLWPRSAAEFPGLILSAFAGLMISATLVLARIQAEKLLEARMRIRNFEKDLQRLAEANVGFQEYSSLIEQHTLRAERDRVSREIHDSTGYALTTLKMIFEAAKGLWLRDPSQILGLMDQGIALSKDALEEVRAALRELRTRRDPVVEGLSFVVRLIRNFETVTNVRIEYDFTNARQSYNPDVNALLYKMVQESLTNAYRHGRASWVRMVFSEADDQLHISISDDGRLKTSPVKGIGLRGMEERLLEVGGSLSFPPRERGFEIMASIPIVKEATHA
jgi:signal transduction histidine kinase